MLSFHNSFNLPVTSASAVNQEARPLVHCGNFSNRPGWSATWFTDLPRGFFDFAETEYTYDCSQTRWREIAAVKYSSSIVAVGEKLKAITVEAGSDSREWVSEKAGEEFDLKWDGSERKVNSDCVHRYRGSAHREVCD